MSWWIARSRWHAYLTVNTSSILSLSLSLFPPLGMQFFGVLRMAGLYALLFASLLCFLLDDIQFVYPHNVWDIFVMELTFPVLFCSPLGNFIAIRCKHQNNHCNYILVWKLCSLFIFNCFCVCLESQRSLCKNEYRCAEQQEIHFCTIAIHICPVKSFY